MKTLFGSLITLYILFAQCRLWGNRAIFVRPWNENARTKQKQQTNGNRAIWLVYWTDTKGRGFWLVKRTLGWKDFTPKNFLEINRHFDLTSYSNTICRSNNVFPILGFSLAANEKAMFWSFHPLADKTNNKPLPKPFFKVIRKSLYSRELFLSDFVLFTHITCAHGLWKRRPFGKTAKYTLAKEVYFLWN